jgi:hypothetical protein
MKNHFTQFIQSHTAAFVLGGIALLVLLMGAFSAGEHIGYRKASFAFQNGNNYYQTFGPRTADRMMPPPDFSDAHGSAGKIVSITLPTLTIQDKDGTEKVLIVSDKTAVRKFRETIAVENLAIGDYIVAIGEPDQQSHIATTLIRVLPPSPTNE